MELPENKGHFPAGLPPMLVMRDNARFCCSTHVSESVISELMKVSAGYLYLSDMRPTPPPIFNRIEISFVQIVLCAKGL
jgi:hypothetical protein